MELSADCIESCMWTVSDGTFMDGCTMHECDKQDVYDSSYLIGFLALINRHFFHPDESLVCHNEVVDGTSASRKLLYLQHSVRNLDTWIAWGSTQHTAHSIINPVVALRKFFTMQMVKTAF